MIENELSKREIEIISIIGLGFVFETVKKILEMLDLEENINKGKE